jgi:DNA-binding response OmpR family regulator
MNALIAPKLLVVSSSLKTGPLWAYTLQENKFDVILENEPARTLRRWSEESPNLVLFDVNDPGTLILSIIRLLREESNVPVLLLTSVKPEEYILEAYDAGVDECIIKPISASLFHAKIKAWLRRSWSVPMDVLDPLRVGNVHLIPAERKVMIGEGAPIHLTNLEMRLLYIMMNRPSRTVAAEDLIQRVWGYTGDADNTVLKNVIYRLRRKIESNQANPVIIHTVAGIGYKFEPAEPTVRQVVSSEPGPA